MQANGGVETLTISGASPGKHLVVRDRDGAEVVTVVADERGNAYVAMVPTEPRVLAGTDDVANVLSSGHPLRPGDYTVDGVPVHVLAVDEHPDPSLHDQELAEGYGYLTVRDGAQLSVPVRFPNQDLYGPPPWPTVVEYSGYTPSDPDSPGPGSLLARCWVSPSSGSTSGVPAARAVSSTSSPPPKPPDGHDVIETVARQPSVLHGHVGMVGLSYPGISQLCVAATQPPHLAAITPLSVIDDPWRQQWPGGIYNSGFTRAWIAARDAQTRAGGQAWDQRRIDAGDEIARANQEIRSQNMDFERFGRATECYRRVMDARRAAALVDRIEVPVFLTGAWHDEQTSSRFALMLGDFVASPEQRFTLFNGHHPDGYSPMVLLRWFEFLSFHVARRVPVVPDLIRQFAPLQFAEVFSDIPELEAERFAHHGDDVDAALVDYRAEAPVRILFDNGAGGGEAGAVGHRYEVEVDSFPPPGVRPWRLHLAGGGTLGDGPPGEPGLDRYEDDLAAGGVAYAGGELASVADLDALTRFTRPVPELSIEWTRFVPEHHVAYLNEPLEGARAVAGAGHVDLGSAREPPTPPCRPPSARSATTASRYGSSAAGIGRRTGSKTTGATSCGSTTPSPPRIASLSRWDRGCGSGSPCTRSPTCSGPGPGSVSSSPPPAETIRSGASRTPSSPGPPTRSATAATTPQRSCCPPGTTPSSTFPPTTHRPARCAASPPGLITPGADVGPGAATT